MSTPTPRTDEALAEDYNASFVSLGQTKTAKEARTLETELTAALARIAELEKIKPVAEGLQRMLSAADHRCESLTRQLAEAQAQLEASKKLASDRLIGLCKCGNEREELQAQLASAREESARLEAVISGGWSIRHKLGTEQAEGDSLWSVNGSGFFTDLRSAIDSARGVTSPPAVADTGEKESPWIDSNETVEVKLNEHGKRHWRETYSGYPTLQAQADAETFKTQLWTLFEVFGPVTYIGGFNHLALRPLPPPPQGKETRE